MEASNSVEYQHQLAWRKSAPEGRFYSGLPNLNHLLFQQKLYLLKAYMILFSCHLYILYILFTEIKTIHDQLIGDQIHNSKNSFPLQDRPQGHCTQVRSFFRYGR